jgi:ElaB/YqjD/DUF883 family membrane-anchored ribosome-binding protein
MGLDQNARNRIKQELETVGNILADLDSEKRCEVCDQLDRLTYELETLARDPTSLPLEEAKAIKEDIEALHKKLTERVESGKEKDKYMYYTLSSLRETISRLGYYLTK